MAYFKILLKIISGSQFNISPNDVIGGPWFRTSAKKILNSDLPTESVDDYGTISEQKPKVATLNQDNKRETTLKQVEEAEKQHSHKQHPQNQV